MRLSAAGETIGCYSYSKEKNELALFVVKKGFPGAAATLLGDMRRYAMDGNTALVFTDGEFRGALADYASALGIEAEAEAREVALPQPMTDLLTDKVLGGQIILEAKGVLILCKL